MTIMSMFKIIRSLKIPEDENFSYASPFIISLHFIFKFKSLSKFSCFKGNGCAETDLVPILLHYGYIFAAVEDLFVNLKTSRQKMAFPSKLYNLVIFVF